MKGGEKEGKKILKEKRCFPFSQTSLKNLSTGRKSTYQEGQSIDGVN